MSYHLVDYPYYVGISEYQEVLDRMVKRLLETNGVAAIYQVGGVGNPGISDLDMLTVFKDGFSAEQNFLSGLSTLERYLFIHNLYGISEKDWVHANERLLFPECKLLFGESAKATAAFSSPGIEILKTQIALEFIVKLYISLSIQETCRVIKIRDLLLHVKALQLDLDYLNITSGPVYEKVLQVIEWRKSWFNKIPPDRIISQWWESFYNEFILFFHSILQIHKFYLPEKTIYRLSKNISLTSTEKGVSFSKKGFLLPGFLHIFGKKYFRLQNKFNHFLFEVPVFSGNIPVSLEKKFQYEKKIVEYNKKYLPYFLPLTSSLHAI
ncbi:MAG TPA: hypothetical protein VJY62_08255 [Bacteroidia bacterium]|nr:hypothetical protein [Bacteroidia bacterium]